MLFPVGTIFFWSIVFLSLLLQNVLLLGLSGLILFLEAVSKALKVRKKNIPIKELTIIGAVARSHVAFLYNLCNFSSRYYLVLSFALFPWQPFVGAIIWVMHAVVGGVEFVNRRPKLNPLSFFWYFTLEQLSYQAGVWWACCKTLNFNPINPRLTAEMK